MLQDAYVRIADARFAAQDVEAAKEAYDAALKAAPAGRLAGWALYRRAWSRFNLREYEGALTDLQQVMKALAPKSDDPYMRKLRETAEKDWVFVYSNAGDPKDAVNSVRSAFPKSYRDKLRLLAETYSNQKRYQHAIRLWKALLDHQTGGLLEQVKLSRRVAEAAARLGDRDSALRALKAAARALAQARTAPQAESKKSKEWKAATANLETTLRETAIAWLKEVERAPDEGSLPQASALAEEHLKLFDKGTGVADIHMAYGSALLAAGRKDQALKELEIAAETHPVGEVRQAARVLMDRARE